MATIVEAAAFMAFIRLFEIVSAPFNRMAIDDGDHYRGYFIHREYHRRFQQSVKRCWLFQYCAGRALYVLR